MGRPALFDDLTPNAVIQSRIVLKTSEFVRAGRWRDEESRSIVNFATLLALKLLSVWLHVDRYQRREAELREAALNKPIERSGSSSVRFVMAQELYIELDEYVVQLKSTLDYVARSPALVLGERGWCVDSFGDHGKLVIRTLNQSTPRSFRNSAKLLASIIEDNSQWLESLIAPSSSFRA